MSIKSACFNLTKAIKASANRASIRDLINSLNHVKQEDQNTERDRAEFGVHARHLYIQALGYLIIEQNRDAIPFPLPRLSSNEIKVLAELHRQLVIFDKKSVARLVKEIPLGEEVTNPYLNYKYTLSVADKKAGFFPKKQTDEVIQEFHNHPGIVQALAYKPQSADKLDKEKYLQGVLAFCNRLQNVGVHDAPDELLRLALANPIQDQRGRVLMHIAGVATVRASLQTLNQLLFQAFYIDKLSLFDENNVIKIVKLNSHVVGEGITFSYAMDGSTFMVEPNDIILLDGPVVGRESVALGWVQSQKISLSDDVGHIGTISAWLLDDNLNPYGGLLKMENGFR